jgi:protein tyrosine phosphatase (PTP) superfamily phosphohydrolase (DUF442 family)
MAFHPDKCNVLSITRNETPIKYPYTLHGYQLEHVDKAKYLGGTIQSDLKWDSHINSITTKANKTLGFLRRNINISSTTVKEQAYKSLVRPSLEYACSVWDPYTKENITQLEQVQCRDARYVTNRYHNTSSVSNMIEHLNWRILAYQRSDARLVMLYKISHELVAIPKTDILIPPLRFSRNMHSLSYQHACNSDSNHSFRKLYETGTASPWTLWRVTLLSRSNQLSRSLITNSSKTLVYSFILKSKVKKKYSLNFIS